MRIAERQSFQRQSIGKIIFLVIIYCVAKRNKLIMIFDFE